jgi:hypothetical protein
MISADAAAVLVLHVVPGAVCAACADLVYPYCTVSDMLARRRSDALMLPALFAMVLWYAGSAHQLPYLVGLAYPLVRLRGPIVPREALTVRGAAHFAWAIAGAVAVGGTIAPPELAAAFGAAFVALSCAGHVLGVAWLVAAACACEWALFYGLPLAFAERRRAHF